MSTSHIPFEPSAEVIEHPSDSDCINGAAAAAPSKPSLLSDVDPRALMLGTLRFWPVIAAIAALSILGGRVASKKMSSKTYTAETIVKYAATGEDARYVDQKTVILTLKDMVKVRDNIQTVKERLGLAESADTIGKALDVHVQKNTTLMVIDTKWSTAPGAADIANVTRNVFLEKYQERVRADMRRQLADLETRLGQVHDILSKRDAELQHFTTQNRIVDIEKQSRAQLEEYNNYGVLLEQAQAERQTVIEQSRRINDAIAELKARVAKESHSMAQLENLADVNTRIERIRDTIQEDKQNRENVALLELRKQEMDQAKRLFDKGFLSEQAYQKTVTAYQVQQIATEDTDQTAKWKEERAKLQQQILPKEGGGTAPSAPILQTMLVRTFDIQLERIAIEKKVLSLQEARARVKSQLDIVPVQQQQYDALQRNIATNEAERKDLEERIAACERAIDSRATDFTVVSDAEADAGAAGSEKKTKIMGATITGLGCVLAIVAATGLALLDTSIRSPRDAEHRLSPLPLLGVLPGRRRRSRRSDFDALPAEEQLTPSSKESAYSERLTIAARRIRQAAPDSGARLLFTGASRRDTATDAATSLASALARQGERVVLVDLTRRGAGPGIADRLAIEATSEESTAPGSSALPEIIQPLPVKRLSIVCRGESPLDSDTIGSRAMHRLLESLSRRFDIVVIVAPPALASIEASLLAGMTDRTVIAVGAGRSRLNVICRAVGKLTDAGAEMAGSLLHEARRPYISWE